MARRFSALPSCSYNSGQLVAAGGPDETGAADE
jgi:hypothetical protein